MKKQTIPLINRSRDFHPSEMFFSTTNRKGIITGCNDVFIRIAAYASDEMLGEPHNLIRHPDVPRCIFKLLWDYILEGKPIGAYVKNLAKTGEYYWVYALIMPVGDDFLSIRMKPSSPAFEIVTDLYTKLLEVENNAGRHWKEEMASASEQLFVALHSMGFENYDAFMAHALREEIKSRKQLMDGETSSVHIPVDHDLYSVFDRIESLISLREVLASKRAHIENVGFFITRLAINSSIIATKLAESGHALSVISEEISRVAHEISEASNELSDKVTSMSQFLQDASFMVSYCLLIAEMCEIYHSEIQQCDITIDEQVETYGNSYEHFTDLLTTIYQDSAKKCGEQLDGLMTLLKDFRDFSEFLHKALLRLRLSFITGKSISASTEGGEQFSEILHGVVDLSEKTREELNVLQSSIYNVNSLVSGWREKDVFQSGKESTQ